MLKSLRLAGSLLLLQPRVVVCTADTWHQLCLFVVHYHLVAGACPCQRAVLDATSMGMVLQHDWSYACSTQTEIHTLHNLSVDDADHVQVPEVGKKLKRVGGTM